MLLNISYVYTFEVYLIKDPFNSAVLIFVFMFSHDRNGIMGRVWLRCLCWAFVCQSLRGACFDSIHRKLGSLACVKLQ